MTAVLSLDELRARWRLRDRRYVLRRTGVSPAEEAMVRHWRQGEARELSPAAREMAYREAERWVPPVAAR